MANIKFSQFTGQAATGSTFIVGFDGTANTKYTQNQMSDFVLSGTLSASRTLTMNAFDLNFASSTAGQQVSFEQNIKVGGQGYTVLHAHGAADLAFNWDNGNVQEATGLSGSPSFTPSNPENGATYIITLAQTGALTPTWTGVKWPAATAPTLSGAGKTDVITLICYDKTANSNAGAYYGSATLDLA